LQQSFRHTAAGRHQPARGAGVFIRRRGRFMNRTLKTAFLISLIANVLLVGVLFGALPRHFGARPSSSYRDRFKSEIAKLPEPARTRLSESIDQARKSDKPALEEIGRARDDALKIVASDPFDAAAYDRQVDKIADLRRALFK